jgi:hypothetical protein
MVSWLGSFLCFQGVLLLFGVGVFPAATVLPKIGQRVKQKISEIFVGARESIS